MQTGSSSKEHDVNKVSAGNSLVVLLFIFGLTAAIFIHMMRWQIYHHDRFSALAKQQSYSETLESSSRGRIFAADGSTLATDLPTWEVFVELSSDKDERQIFFNSKSEFVKQVSAILASDATKLEEQLSDDFRHIRLAEELSDEKKVALENAKVFPIYNKDGEISGYKPNFVFRFVRHERRIYPNNSLASHILGFIGKDGEGKEIGLYGIEGYFANDLSSKATYSYKEVDIDGNVILTNSYEPRIPRSGKDITLTINPTVQSDVEQVLENWVNKSQAKSGTTIIMDPQTGALLAMANYPTYNPNEYWRTQDPNVLKNAAVATTYEPGSIMKPLTIAIGIESGKIDETTTCNDPDGKIIFYEGRPDQATIYTWDKKPDGLMTPAMMLQFSNNPCIVETAMKIGLDYYYPKMKAFGIGEFLGLGLQDEANAYIQAENEMSELDFAVTSFGQSVSATALQMISAVGTIANEKGERMQPYIIKEIVDENGTTKIEPKVLAQPISAETALRTRRMMQSVVEEGEVRKLFREYLDEYEISGKTGTAQVQKVGSVGYYADRTNATFVAMAPIEHPKIIMLVKIEEPGIGTFAAETAVPAWIETFLKIKDDLGIPKE